MLTADLTGRADQLAQPTVLATTMKGYSPAYQKNLGDKMWACSVSELGSGASTRWGEQIIQERKPVVGIETA